MKTRPDVNDTLREHGPDAVRQRHDRAKKYNGPDNENGARRSTFQLIPFRDLLLGTTRNYVVKGIIPRTGIVLVWGPPKCGKSFWTFDLMMHVALDWMYRGHRVMHGEVVYCAFEELRASRRAPKHSAGITTSSTRKPTFRSSSCQATPSSSAIVKH